jgi:CBS domain-containing protein
MPKVRDLLAKKSGEVSSIGEKESVLTAAKKMNALRIGSLVITHGDQVIGIFSERDILTRVVAEGLKPEEVLVGDVMTSPVACCRLDTTLEECKAVMTSKHIRRLPVVEGGKLHGIVTSGDIMATQSSEQAETIEYLKDYLYGPGTPE